MKTITDASILNDLEYRGIDAFLSEMNAGIVVPQCFVQRVTAIVEENYGIDLVPNGDVFAKQEGNYCLMPYNDTSVTLVGQ